MDIIVLLFVIMLIIIDKNIRQRMFAALSAAVSLRHSVDIDNDMYDTADDTDDIAMSQRSDTSDTHVTTHDTHSDIHVKTMSQRMTSNVRHVKANVTRNDTSDKHVTANVTSTVTDDIDTDIVSQEAIDAVSRLVAANVVSATRACQIAFNVSSRGNTAIYRAVRARVAELKKMSNMSQQDEIIDIRSDGRVIRCDNNGKYYVIHSDGSKEYLSNEEVSK